MNIDGQSDIKNYIGWLALDGTHFSCDRYGHDALSRNLLEECCKIKVNDMKTLVCDDMLINMGWCRIGFSSFLSHGYTIQANWSRISEMQKSFIRNMYFVVGDLMTENTINYLKDYEIINLYKESVHVAKEIKKLKK